MTGRKRASKRRAYSTSRLAKRVEAYIAQERGKPPGQAEISLRAVARELRVAPTTLTNHGLGQTISDAASELAMRDEDLGAPTPTNILRARLSDVQAERDSLQSDLEALRGYLARLIEFASNNGIDLQDIFPPDLSGEA